MNTRNQSNTSDHSTAFHEQQLPLFDAYITDELNTNERGLVEQSLSSCKECQQLFTDVTDLRHTLGTLSQNESVSATELTQQMVQAVMASIEQKEESGNHFTADDERQAQAFTNVPRVSITTRKRIRPMSLSIGVALICLILLVGFLITLPPTSRNKPISVPSPVRWVMQREPMLVRNNAGVFALKEIEITKGKEFRFYYVFQSSHQGTIHVTAISSLNAAQAHPVTLSTTVLPLGTIDNFRIGVIRVQFLDRVDQTITLNITSSEERNVKWQLTPLKQLLADPPPQEAFYRFSIDQSLLPEVVWSGPYSGSRSLPPYSMIGFFKNKASTRYIFLLIDYSGKIEVISREKCIQLVGKQGCS